MFGCCRSKGNPHSLFRESRERSKKGSQRSFFCLMPPITTTSGTPIGIVVANFYRRIRLRQAGGKFLSRVHVTDATVLQKEVSSRSSMSN